MPLHKCERFHLITIYAKINIYISELHYPASKMRPLNPNHQFCATFYPVLQILVMWPNTVHSWISTRMKGKRHMNNWKIQIIQILGVIGKPRWLLNTVHTPPTVDLDTPWLWSHPPMWLHVSYHINIYEMFQSQYNCNNLWCEVRSPLWRGCSFLVSITLGFLHWNSKA